MAKLIFCDYCLWNDKLHQNDNCHNENWDLQYTHLNTRTCREP